MPPIVRVLAGAIPAVAIALLAGAGPAAREVRAGDPCYHRFVPPAHLVEASGGVKVLPCAFEPTVAVVPVGGSVTFRSSPDGPAHLVTGANQAWGERDIELPPDGTVTYTFDEPGLYPYACALHRGMSGAIVVGDGGAALAAAIASASPDAQGLGSAPGVPGASIPGGPATAAPVAPAAAPDGTDADAAARSGGTALPDPVTVGIPALLLAAVVGAGLLANRRRPRPVEPGGTRSATG